MKGSLRPIRASRRVGSALHRFLAFMLAATIACHLLPLTLCQEDCAALILQGETALSFEPLQVCDDGSDFSGFLADHPWVPGSVFQAPFLPDRPCCLSTGKAEFSEGVPRSVYRPPRSILS